MVYSAIQVLHVNVLVIIKDQVIIIFIGQIHLPHLRIRKYLRIPCRSVGTSVGLLWPWTPWKMSKFFNPLKGLWYSIPQTYQMSYWVRWKRLDNPKSLCAIFSTNSMLFGSFYVSYLIFLPTLYLLLLKMILEGGSFWIYWQNSMFTFILISQLIANGLHGALGKVVQEAVEEVPRKDTDRNLL